MGKKNKEKKKDTENILDSAFLLVRVATHTVIKEVKKALSHADYKNVLANKQNNYG